MKVRPIASVRVRITAAATVVFALAFGLAAFGLIAKVRDALEDDLRRQSAASVGRVEAQLEAGTPFDQALAEPAFGGMVAVQVLGPDGEALDPRTDPRLVGAQGSPVDAGEVAEPDRSDPARPPFVTPVTGLSAAIGAAQLPPGGDVMVVYREADTPGGPLTIVGTSSLAGVQTSVNTLGTVLVVGTPVLVALVGLLVWVLVGRALRPVEAIRAEVDEISHTTIHRRIAEPGTGDEVQRLAHTMNEMLDRLDTAATAQRRFVSDASHELKTPLATNRARLEVALAHPEATDWVTVSADVLATEDRLTRLVTDLLDMAQLHEAGPDPARAEPVDVGTVVTEVCDANDWGDVDVRPDTRGGADLTIPGDRAALARLVQNVVANARQHGRAPVCVTVARSGDEHHPEVELTVDDSGPGIPPDQRAAVLERFTRLDVSRARSSGGTGLGLPIAKALAERHGGTLAVTEAPPPFGGARVVIRLPASATSDR